KLQVDGDLGLKMEHAFLDIFELGYEKVVIIGSDLLDLKPQHITLAFESLNKTEMVICTAEDGGYYLLRLTRMKTILFRNKTWSTNNLLNETLKEIKENNIQITTLESINDIDTVEDLTSSKS